MDLSPKQKAFLMSKAKTEFLEGTTASGKTHTARIKILLKCMASKYSTHVILGASKGKVEDNVLGVNEADGFLKTYQDEQHLIEYYPNGHGLISDAHLILHCVDKNGKPVDKTIYIWGGGDISALTKVRGGVYGCGYIDELNMVNEDVARELKMRSNDWFCGSLNPDNPDKGIYKLVNKSRPLPEFADDVPKEIRSLLVEKAQKDWVYWHFNFNDNPIMTQDMIENKMSSFEIGTSKYNSLILGLRTRLEGVIFDCFSAKNLIDECDIMQSLRDRNDYFIHFTAGLDTSFSSNTPDMNALIFSGITSKGHIYILEEYTINNRDLREKDRIYASDLCPILDERLTAWRKKWGIFNTFFVDSADANTLGEFGKYRRTHGSDFHAVKCDKKTFNIKARNDKINEWLQSCYLHINKNCEVLISEFYTYAYDEKNQKPLDANNHTIDAFNYSWTSNLYTKIGTFAKF